MLDPNYLQSVEEQAIKLYSDLELEIIQEIAERISNVGYANTVVKNDVLIAQEMGMLYQDIINMVAEYNDESYEKIQRIFNETGIKTLQFDDSIYKEAGLNPIPIKQNKTMLDLLIATAKKTNENLQNLVMTTASTSQNEFINAMNMAYMEVSTGIKSYSQSIIDTISKVSEKGSIVQYPSGYRTSIENAVRMNIVTGVNQTCGKLQLMRAEELRWDLMELTAHSGARPTHAEWQGKIVSLSGKSGYLSLDDIGYGEVTGFKGVNCNHDWMPFNEGSTRTYTNKELERMNNETVTYNGQQMKRYDAQQMQRGMERQIRQDKKDIAGIKGLLTSNNKNLDTESAKSKLQQLQNRYNMHNNKLNDFLEQTKFRKDNSRLFVGKQVTRGGNSGIMTKITHKKEDEMNYKDITSQYTVKKKYQIAKQKYFIDNKGTRYIVDGKHVILKPSEREEEVANLIGQIFGGEVNIIPRISYPQGIKTPDYIIDKEKYDLKTLTENNKNTVYNALHKQKLQANNFIIDISINGMTQSEAEKQINSIYKSRHTEWVKRIILIKDDKILKIYQRK